MADTGQNMVLIMHNICNKYMAMGTNVMYLFVVHLPVTYIGMHMH